jgi:hypothetical protein
MAKMKKEKNHGFVQMSKGGAMDNVASPGSMPKKIHKTSSKEPKAIKRKGAK